MKCLRVVVAIGFCIACNAEPVTGAHIAIKEFHLGMSAKEAQYAVARYYDALDSDSSGRPPFTVANKFAKYVTYGTDGDTVDQIAVMMDSEDFDAVSLAVNEKYHGLVCKNSSIQNKMGATFRQTTCRYERGGEILTLYRYATNTETMAIILESRARLARESAEAKAGSRDL